MYELEQVSVRLVKETALYSTTPINTQDKAVAMIRDVLSEYDRECFAVVNLNAALRPINVSIISIGSINQAITDPAQVFKPAILSNAASIILLHNHPSGNEKPSEDDIATTKRLVKAGEILGLRIIDHVIATPTGRYFSFKEGGLMTAMA